MSEQKEMVNHPSHYGGEDNEYDSKNCPASYGRGDGWAQYIDEYEEKLIEKLLKTGILKKDENEPLDEDDLDELLLGDGRKRKKSTKKVKKKSSLKKKIKSRKH